MTHPQLLALVSLLYFGVCFAWRSVVVRRRTGINPLVLDRSDSVHGYIGRSFKLTIIVAYVPVALAAWKPEMIRLLGHFGFFDSPAFSNTGLAMILLSACWTAIAQLQMGNSWRIGIDFQRQTELVSRGLYRYSRNPIFLGMMVTLLGLFLAIPTGISLSALLLGVVLIQIQTRLEEEFLARSHGEAYREYLKRVPRWIGVEA